jgi:hypothetical protein
MPARRFRHGGINSDMIEGEKSNAALAAHLKDVSSKIAM